QKYFRICLLILMKTINQSFEAIPFIQKYFGDSNSNNPNNIGTLEIYEIMKKSNTVWLLPEIFDIEQCTVHITLQNNQQLSIPIEILSLDDSDLEKQLKDNLDLILLKSINNCDNEMELLADKIWSLFIED
ncbi:6283_t:CDS:1, partial [Cetraspora pellucida]